MTERESESKRPSRHARGQGVTRWVYGSLLVAIGACIGIVIGSVSETPRVFLERMRGPVETVDLEKPDATPPVADAETPPQLEAFDELQGAPAKPEPKKTAAATPPAKAPPAKPAAPAKPAPPQVSSPPPPAPPAKSAAEIVKSLEAKTAPPAPSAAGAKSSVIQVLSLAERKQADALVAKLKTQGYESYVTPMPGNNGRFRVRVRPGAGQTAAELEPKLKALGLKTWVTAE